MKNALLVGLGGFVGCVARYLTGVLVSRVVEALSLPYATLLVNVIGCLLIGLLSEAAGDSSVTTAGQRLELRLLLVVGFLGGLTTFSTFGLETFTLGREGQPWVALLNVAAHLLLGLGAIGAGMWLAKLT